MSMCANEAVAGVDETYWADGKAAVPVLLLDEATEAITEAVHRIRRGSVLEQRDMAATGVALGDLFGGLSQLAELWTTLVDRDTGTDPAPIGQLDDRSHALRIMMLTAQQVAGQLGWGSSAIPVIRCNERIPAPRHDHNKPERFSNATPVRTPGRGSPDRSLANREVRLVRTRAGGSRSVDTA